MHAGRYGTLLLALAFAVHGSAGYAAQPAAAPEPGVLESKAAAGDGDTGDPLVAVEDPQTGQIHVRQGNLPVLTYNYRTVEPPPGYLEKVTAANRKYARPRSDYIHPLYGLDGEPLTNDWSLDHPHHRGIYWAWPEVQYGDQLGDLHALQRVFARPTDTIELRYGKGFAQIQAEHQWLWEDRTPIVRETARIRVHAAAADERCVDLRFEFVALADAVSIARRGTNAYGGLNLRLAPVQGLRLSHVLDPAEAPPRGAWQSASGTWQGGGSPACLAVFESCKNPGYPGDYVQYPDLPWFQPTFPRSGTRYPLDRDHPLVLRYRLWIHRGDPPPQAELRTRWAAYQAARRDLPALDR